MKHSTNDYNDPWDKHKNPYDPWDKSKMQKHKGYDIPKVITINDLFPRLDRLSIGWSPLLDTLREVTNAKPAYPPYDIVKLNDVTNVLHVAVAGFSKSEITVTIQDTVLTVTGKKTSKPEGEIIYQGIAARDFELKLAIADYWVVESAEVVDGMLMVTFVKELPEEKKPKVIDIK